MDFFLLNFINIDFIINITIFTLLTYIITNSIAIHTINSNINRNIIHINRKNPRKNYKNDGDNNYTNHKDN